MSRAEQDTRLTAQEQDILAPAATGWSATAVAEELGLTPETVCRSLASAIVRVGARSKIEAVMIAVRHGLIDLPTNQAGTLPHGQRASASRPVMRLLAWGKVCQPDMKGSRAVTNTGQRVIELRREQIADVDGAAT
jgi:DNA-binding CsgD family transcriptional regulator